MPNFVIILTDDQRADMLSAGVQTQLVAQGFNFTNAICTTPVCGPSRASLLTGQWAHTHGCNTNVGTAAMFGQRPSLGTVLQSAGYTTAWAGKWLNDYDAVSPAIPPGWTHWVGYVAPQIGAHFNYTLNHSGVEQGYTTLHLTDVLALTATDWLHTLPEPFCVVFAPGAPHSPYTPAARHVGAHAGAPWIPPAGAFEVDMTDKPQWLQDFQAAHGPSQPTLTTEITHRHNAQREMLLAVDEALNSFLEILTARGLLARTAVIYTSDNGLHEYEHWWAQKMTPYEPSLRVPLVIRYAGWGGAPVAPKRLVTLADLGVTIAALAGTTLPQADGQDLRAIFVNPLAWRTSAPIEYWAHSTWPWQNVPGFFGAREKSLVYWQLEDAARCEELYDLVADPGQLVNQVQNPTYAAAKARMRQEAGLA